MHRLTLLFCALAIVVQSQTTIFVNAPVSNNTSSGVAPAGYSSQTYMRGSFLIRANELSSLTTSLITGMALNLNSGASNLVNGNIDIYFENTNDFNYSKGTTYTNVINNMTTVYSGVMTLPATTNSAAINFNLSAPFNYTGGGLYVAYSWTATAPFATSGAVYKVANNGGSPVMGAYRQSNTNSIALSTLISNGVRPVCTFYAVNTATNEAAVVGITAPGKIAEAIHSPHIIMANIKNGSVNSLNNLSVTLNVNGANSFYDNQVISSLAPGAVTTVSFAPFDPAYLGTNSVIVSVPTDENATNNSLQWTQSVTCNQTANNPHDFSNASSWGFITGTGIFSSRYNFAITTTLTGVSFLFINTFTTPVYGVLMDGVNGNIIATTNTMLPSFAWPAVLQTFTFSTPEVLSANTDYNIGLVQTQAGQYPMSIIPADAAYSPGLFFWSPPTGGQFNPENDGYYVIEPVSAGPDITITQASTVICYGQTATLTANGAINYTWTSSIFNPIDFPNDNQIIITPTGNEIYTVTATDDAGCTGSATAPLAVKICTGLDDVVNSGSVLNIFPNPNQGNKTYISGLADASTIAIYSLIGELVLTQLSTAETTEIKTSDLVKGTYFVKITESGGRSNTLKLVKL